MITFLKIIGPGFQGVDRFFVSSFENNADGTGQAGYFLPKVEIINKYYSSASHHEQKNKKNPPIKLNFRQSQ